MSRFPERDIICRVSEIASYYVTIRNRDINNYVAIYVAITSDYVAILCRDSPVMSRFSPLCRFFSVLYTLLLQ